MSAIHTEKSSGREKNEFLRDFHSIVRRFRTVGWQIGVAALALGTGFASIQPAQALPSFARQTGKPCSQCHTMSYGPALTSYGRQFKLNGYVWGDAKQIIPPLALMVQGGFTNTSKAQVDPPADHFALNNNLSIDQVSLFYGGRITEHSGAFIQTTYSGEDRVYHWDNLDVRYARSATLGDKNIVFGVTVNNNPTVQDLWNSTPGWGYPYIVSALAPTPTAHPLLAGGLAQLALGATGYAMVDDHLYVEAGAYKGITNRWLGNLGLGSGASINMDGASPYWRAAWQMELGQQYFSVGMLGITAKVQPDPTAPQTDRFNDVGFDATYQFSNDTGHAVAVNFLLVHEKQTLDASFAAGNSANGTDNLTSANMDVSYMYQQTYGATVGLFNSTGTTDTGLYAPGTVSGSLNGSPNYRGYSLQVEYVPFGKFDSFANPWLNLRVGLQYTAYLRFNGADGNYDGFGRSASDNNTLFGFFWFAL